MSSGPSVLVFDYGLARPERIVHALRRAGGDVRVSPNLHDIRAADRLVLPDGDDDGHSLERGMNPDVLTAIAAHIGRERPLCAIGLSSMFLLSGRCHPEMPSGLDLFKAPIQCFDPRMTDELERPLKSPHTGFSYIVGLDRHPHLRAVVPEGEKGVWMYFRHRLCAPARIPFADVAVAHHGVPFAGAIWRAKTLALQFLPELSGPIGLKTLQAWLKESE